MGDGAGKPQRRLFAQRQIDRTIEFGAIVMP